MHDLENELLLEYTAVDIEDAYNILQRKLIDLLPKGTEYTIHEFRAVSSTFALLTVRVEVHYYWDQLKDEVRRV